MEDNTNVITKILRMLDLFGQPVVLYVKGKSSFKTSAGGLITLMLFIITIILFGVSLKRLIQSENMNSQEYTKYQASPPLLNFTNDNFIFSFNMDDPNLTPNNSLFSYNVTLYTVLHENPDSENLITLKHEIEFGRCDENVYDKFAKFTKKSILSRSLCPKNYSYPLLGTKGDKVYQYIKILINKCVNNTHPDIVCAPNENITEYFKNTTQIKFRLYFVNHNIDLYNHENPYQSFIDNQLWFVSPLGTLSRKTEIFFRSIVIQSNDDLAGISEPTIYTTHTFQQDRYDWTYVPLTNNQLYFEIELKAGYYKTTYIRTYGTFLQTIAFIGGIFNMLHLSLGIIAKLINEHAYRIKLANILYGFDTLYLNPNQQNAIKTQYEDTKGSRLNTPTDTKILKSELIKLKFNNLKDLRKGLIYPALFYITNRIWCCFSTKLMKKKDKLFKLAIRKITSEVDIENIMRKLQEVDKLKNILFTSDQLGIFNFVETSIISPKIYKNLDKNDEKKRILTEDRMLIENGIIHNFCKDLSQYYRHYKMYSHLKKEANLVNQNLLSSLNPEVCELFDLIEDDCENNNKKDTEECLTEQNRLENCIDEIKISDMDKSLIKINFAEKSIHYNSILHSENDEYCIESVNTMKEIMKIDEINKKFEINEVKVKKPNDFKNIKYDKKSLKGIQTAPKIPEHE